ncbi:MAG: glycosyltransferase family 4 protein [Methanobacterium sp.]|nr:glycosyltransferase family 4 protein [Methanobacterium sp.]
MKVLIINGGENSCPGGVNKTVRETAKNLSLRGHQVILLQENPYNKPEKELKDGYEIIRIKTRLGNILYGFSFEILFKFRRLFQDIKPDIVHLHGYHALLSLEIIKLIRNLNPRIPIVFSPHLDVYRSSIAGKYLWNIYNFFGKSIFKDSTHIISPSNYEAENIINNYDISPESITIIPHGVNLIEDQERGNLTDKPDNGNSLDNLENGNLTDKHQKTRDKNETCRMLYSGYLVERKGVNYIIESLNYLVNVLNFKDVKLTIIGDGPEKDNLKKLSETFKLDDYVLWKTFLPEEEYINEIKDSTVFLLLSNSEAYGISVAEALALRTPCLVSRKTAIKEFLNEPGCLGVDYPPKPELVAGKVLEIYNHDIQVGPFSDKIRTWDKVSGDYEKVYQELLYGRRI